MFKNTEVLGDTIAVAEAIIGYEMALVAVKEGTRMLEDCLRGCDVRRNFEEWSEVSSLVLDSRSDEITLNILIQRTERQFLELTARYGKLSVPDKSLHS